MVTNTTNQSQPKTDGGQGEIQNSVELQQPKTFKDQCPTKLHIEKMSYWRKAQCDNLLDRFDCRCDER